MLSYTTLMSNILRTKQNGTVERLIILLRDNFHHITGQVSLYGPYILAQNFQELT